MVVPETPQPLPQRDKKTSKGKEPGRTLFHYNFVNQTRSDTHLTNQNKDVSIEISESRTQLNTSNESVSPLIQALNTKSTETIIPMRTILSIGADNLPDTDSSVPGGSKDPTPLRITIPNLREMNEQRSTSTQSRFDKQIQTSKEKLDPMKNLGSFMNNMLLNIKHSNFEMRNNDRNLIRPNTGVNENPVLPLFNLQNRVDVRIFEPAKTNWKTLRNLQGKKVQLELRIAFNQKLLESDHFPSWAVSFKPPLNLLATERAVEATASDMSKLNDQF